MNTERQSLAKTVAFRFAAVYFILYSLCTLTAQWFGIGWEILVFCVSWVGANVLGIDSMSFERTGSGDTTADYVTVFMFAVLTIVAGVGWTAFDRGRTTYPRFAAWLTVWVRYWLGMIMISYGIVKVFPLQFPAHDLVRLGDTYGESSPMGLLWTFMGHSPVYSAFAGGAEVLGGVLLFWRRTTSLGALICIGVLTNIVVLNFCYDVPVKLFSSHLLLVALVLAGQDADRLIGAVLGRAVPARLTPPITTTLRGHRIRWAIKSLFLLGFTGWIVLTVRMSRELVMATVPLEGVYDVVSHELRCDPSRSCGDELRWRRVVFGRFGLALEPVQGSRSKHHVEVDGGGLVLSSRDGGPIMLLDYHEPFEGTLILEGNVGGVEHRITLERVDDPGFRLVDRGFHWINETPFNL